MTEKDLTSLQDPKLKVLIGIAKSVDVNAKTVHLQDGSCCSYDKLCICSGAVPKVNAMPKLSSNQAAHMYHEEFGPAGRSVQVSIDMQKFLCLRRKPKL